MKTLALARGFGAWPRVAKTFSDGSREIYVFSQTHGSSMLRTPHLKEPPGPDKVIIGIDLREGLWRVEVGQENRTKMMVASGEFDDINAFPFWVGNATTILQGLTHNFLFKMESFKNGIL